MGFGTAALNSADVLRSRSSISATRRSSCASASPMMAVSSIMMDVARGSHAQSALRALRLRSASMILVRCFHSDSYVACSLSDCACSAAVSSVACTGMHTHTHVRAVMQIEHSSRRLRAWGYSRITLHLCWWNWWIVSMRATSSRCCSASWASSLRWKSSKTRRSRRRSSI